MRNTLAIAQREMNSLFFSPIAYVLLTLFTIPAALFFFFIAFRPNSTAELRVVFAVMNSYVLIPLVPAISMRLMSEELRSGTVETLMTAPVRDVQVVLGKWLGAWGFFALLLMPTLAFVVTLEIYANPDYGPILTAYAGLMLAGGLYLAIGTFASVMTRSQVIAFVVTLFVILMITLLTYLLPMVVVPSHLPLIDLDARGQTIVFGALAAIGGVAGIVVALTTRSRIGGAMCGFGLMGLLAAVAAPLLYLPAKRLNEAIQYVNVSAHLEDFLKGVVDLADLMFFVSGTALFLVLATIAFESRRWR